MVGDGSIALDTGFASPCVNMNISTIISQLCFFPYLYKIYFFFQWETPQDIYLRLTKQVERKGGSQSRILVQTCLICPKEPEAEKTQTKGKQSQDKETKYDWKYSLKMSTKIFQKKGKTQTNDIKGT